MTHYQPFIQTYGKDEVVFEQGSPGRDMYVVLSGTVTLYQANKVQPLIPVATLQAGDMFGEMTLITESPRSATARATAPDTQLIRIDQARFVYLTSQQPAFALSVMRVLAQRLAAVSTPSLTTA